MWGDARLSRDWLPGSRDQTALQVHLHQDRRIEGPVEILENGSQDFPFPVALKLVQYIFFKCIIQFSVSMKLQWKILG